jgi:glycosyltransferase involved in cell wall biosynthesis
LKEVVVFPGCLGGERKLAVLVGADIFLNTASIDNTPVSVLEAMASGLCVVSTNVGGIPDLLAHEKDALLVPADSPSAMAEAAKRILMEPGLAERLSLDARCKAEGFDWRAVRPQWDALFSEVHAHA